jgi:hypothetical protein
MNTRILTIAAAAIAVTAIGFTAPASATSLGAAGQTIAQSVDSPVIQVGKKGGGKKWGGKGGHKWHGKKWHGKHYGYKGFHYGLHAPYHYGGCYQQVQALVNGYYVWTTVNLCN